MGCFLHAFPFRGDAFRVPLHAASAPRRHTTHRPFLPSDAHLRRAPVHNPSCFKARVSVQGCLVSRNGLSVCFTTIRIFCHLRRWNGGWQAGGLPRLVAWDKVRGTSTAIPRCAGRVRGCRGARQFCPVGLRVPPRKGEHDKCTLYFQTKMSMNLLY